MPDSLLPEDLVPRLRGRLGRPYRYAEQCASTQRLLAADDPEGAVAVAGHQTEGRGRLGRVWRDAPGTALLVSVVLRPRVPAEHLAELSPVAGRACADAIAAATGLAAQVKFPNDVLVSGRKVAGVLAEAGGGRVVLGIGVNVNQTESDLPERTRLPATSLRIETGTRQDRAELLVALLDELERGYDAWNLPG